MLYYLALTHKITVTLFLLIYFIKAVLLLSNKKDQLINFSTKVKVPEMIISFLFLATGVYMLIKGGHPELYLMVKIVLVLASIPLAIIGIKKSNKVLLALSVLILIYVYGVAETKSLTFSKSAPSGIIMDARDDNYKIEEHGRALYQQHCMRCHGMEGNKMRYDSPDLTQSKLSNEERWKIINNGKGMMPAFENALDENESKALDAFLNTLKSNSNSK